MVYSVYIKTSLIQISSSESFCTLRMFYVHPYSYLSLLDFFYLIQNHVTYPEKQAQQTRAYNS